MNRFSDRGSTPLGSTRTSKSEPIFAHGRSVRIFVILNIYLGESGNESDGQKDSGGDIADIHKEGIRYAIGIA